MSSGTEQREAVRGTLEPPDVEAVWRLAREIAGDFDVIARLKGVVCEAQSFKLTAVVHFQFPHLCFAGGVFDFSHHKRMRIDELKLRNRTFDARLLPAVVSTRDRVMSVDRHAAQRQSDAQHNRNPSRPHNVRFYRTEVCPSTMEHPALIEFEHVTVMRGSTIAVNDISLKIGVGEHVAILGPNGCGKSTLIKAITRECYPLVAEGSFVRILGEERWNVFELRTLLGIVSNDLMATCTRPVSGRDIVLSGFFSSIGIWPHQEVTSEMHERADHALAMLEVPQLADRFTNEMSSGEARRVLLARALVHDPRALILDEPSIALDLGAQHDLRLILRKLAQSGIGIVMVTHHLSDLIPEIERVVLMDRGHIVADGPKREVLVASRLSALFGQPLELSERDGYYNLW